MPVKIFVGRLAEGTSRDDLTTLFKKYGEVVECDVISNYGFVVSLYYKAWLNIFNYPISIH